MSKIKKVKEAEIEIIEQEDQLWTTSLNVSEKFGKKHYRVLRAIENLECSKEFTDANFGVGSYLDQNNQERPMMLISKEGFSFLAMGFTGKEAAQWKEKYIAAFKKMKTTIERLLLRELRQTEKRAQIEWQQSRSLGKVSRRQETDAIQEFKQYCIDHGSGNANRYYCLLTAMANKVLFRVKKGKCKGGVRNQLDINQLRHAAIVDDLISRELRERMANEQEYHKIYEEIKAVVEKYASLVSPEPLILDNSSKQMVLTYDE